MVKIVETKERENAEAAAAKKAKTIAESENDDDGFSKESDNILSVTERLGLEIFAETWDTSSVSSKKSKSSKSKTKSAEFTSFMEKASNPKEDTVSSSTKANVKKLMSPSKQVSFHTSGKV